MLVFRRGLCMRNRVKAACLSALTGVISWVLVSSPATAVDSMTSAQLTALSDAVTRIETMVLEPNTRFSASKTIAELSELEKVAGASDAARAELRRVLLLKGLVELKRENLTAARDGYVRAFAIELAGMPPSVSEMHDHDVLAGIASDLGDWPLAIKHYEAAHELAKGQSDITDSQRLQLRQMRAFVLHEAGRYGEALSANTALLADGERILGADSPQLKTILTNLAQNLHALGRGPEAAPYLLRCLAIARKHRDNDKVQNMLFQLGVLAFENGQRQAARSYMTDRVTLVAKLKRPELLASAREDLAILEDKLKSRK